MNALPSETFGHQYTWNKSDLFFGLMQGIALLCVICQICIEAHSDNLNCVALVVASSSLVIQYLWRSKAAIDYPNSSLALLGLCVTTQFAALVAQTLSWTPFIAMLRWPLFTFSVLAAVLVLAVFTHWVYRHLAFTNSLTASIANNVLAPIGAFTAPPAHTLWIMGGIGMVAMLSSGVATGDVGGKAFQALSFLAYIPFMIFLYHRLYGNSYCNMKKQGPLLIAFTISLMMVAMARNARQVMVTGPVQICLILLIYFLQDPAPITKRTITRLLTAAAAIAIAIALFTDVAIAMVITRDKLQNLTPLERIKDSVEVWMDRPRLKRYQEAFFNSAEFLRYDEAYLANPVLSRFSETKFHDNNIYFSSTVNESEHKELVQLSKDKLLNILPQPVLDALDIDLQKNSYSFTFGDFNRYLREGPNDTLGGFVTSSIWGHIIALFGLEWAAPVVVILLMFSYVMLDSYSRRGRGFDVAPMAMCSTWAVFINGLSGDSLIYNIGFYVRDFPQRLMLYLIVYAGVKYGLMLFKQQDGHEEVFSWWDRVARKLRSAPLGITRGSKRKS